MSTLDNPSRRQALLTATGLAASALLPACGGGGTDAAVSDSTANTSAASSYALGAISGFGSVVVAGVRFDDSRAECVDEDGNPVARSALRLGMVVAVDAGAVDRSNASALALLPRDSSHRTDRLWTLVQDTCPLPLLDHWRDTVLELLQARAMLSRLPSAIGALEGHRLAIDVPALTAALGDLIRNSTLGASRYELASGAPLRRVA